MEANHQHHELPRKEQHSAFGLSEYRNERERERERERESFNNLEAGRPPQSNEKLRHPQELCWCSTAVASKLLTIISCFVLRVSGTSNQPVSHLPEKQHELPLPSASNHEALPKKRSAIDNTQDRLLYAGQNR